MFAFTFTLQIHSLDTGGHTDATVTLKAVGAYRREDFSVVLYLWRYM
jgi:hypothetical protein